MLNASFVHMPLLQDTKARGEETRWPAMVAEGADFLGDEAAKAAAREDAQASRAFPTQQMVGR